VYELKLPVKVKAALDDYIVGLRATYTKDLVSVILYGSASSGEFTDRYSNVNVMVVLKETSLPNLSRAHPLVSSKKFSMISPVFFTEEYIFSSLDVFPIEFLDIVENYTVLYGKDIMSGIKVDSRNLRFQCEHELKSKLINIKRRYLISNKQKELENLLFTTFTSTLHIMRNMLRLKGINPPYMKEAILSEYEIVFGRDIKTLSKILWAKNKKMALTYRDIDALLVGFVAELEIIASAVDKL